MSIPEFSLRPVVNVGGIPHLIIIRPIWRGDQQPASDFAIATRIVDRLQHHIYLAVNRYNRWDRTRVFNTTRGYLNAINLETGDSKTFDEIGSVRDLTVQMILEVLEKIHQSNGMIRLYELEWQFTIDIASIAQGGNPLVKVPSWSPSVKYRDTWQHQGVNCAAYALVRLSSERRLSTSKHLIVKDAHDLANEMRWGTFITIEDLGKVVTLQRFWKYKVVVLIPPLDFAHHVYTGKRYVANGAKDILYLFYDSLQKHFAAVVSPRVYLQNTRGNSTSVWCHTCCGAFRNIDGHECKVKKVYPSKKCDLCSRSKSPGHVCGEMKCKNCKASFKIGGYEHRCVLWKEERSEEKNHFYGDDEERVDQLDGSLPCLISYDMESSFKRVNSHRVGDVAYQLTDNHQYVVDGDVEQGSEVLEHHPNLIIAQNVFTEELFYFKGLGCVGEFIEFLYAYNQGNHVCLAHNGSGYDTRLIFTELRQRTRQDVKPIFRGGKIMQLKVGKIIFRDSLLHLKGRLSTLMKEFGAPMEKGMYPYLFNTEENWDYVGEKPGLEYFDLSLSCKSKKEYVEFMKNYQALDGVWDNQKELIRYCEIDVKGLTHIVKHMHYFGLEANGITPWMNSTAPSYYHEVSLINRTKALKAVLPEMTDVGYLPALHNAAWNDTWAVLKPWEYTFARMALRGGRTEIRKMWHCLSEEDWNRGVRIRYQDVNSLYPYQQMAHDFPVGLPTIHYWDLKYKPCYKHQYELSCDCLDKTDRFMKMVACYEQPSREECLDYFGLVCVTLIPPKDLFHPVLVCWNAALKKCVCSLRDEDHVEIVITSIELKTALEVGYELVKVHAYHQYARKASLWKEDTMKLYIEKMLNSRNAPPEQEREAFKKTWDQVFPGMGDMMEGSWDRWGKNPAKKLMNKIGLNSGWGKHAQRLVMPEHMIVEKRDAKKIVDLFQDFSSGALQHQRSQELNDDWMMYQFSTGDSMPDYHGTYLPASVFVPAYGRIQLWKELHKLGDRVLMCDTDSIVYVYDPLKVETLLMIGECSLSQRREEPYGW